jgi:C4-dicarboxylate-binding protein DctP
MTLRTILKSTLAVALLAGSLSAATTIRVTLQLPESHPLGDNWKEFKKIVEEKSNGELKVLIFPSAQLYKDNQVPEAVGTGAIEAGSASLGRFAGSVPAVDVVSLPFLFDNEAHLRANVAAGSKMRSILDKAILEETGAKILWWQAYGHNVYLNNGDPIRTPDGLKGKKIRTYGKVQGWTAEAFGGAPTLLSGSKQFLAYQQGAVDVGMTGLSAVESRKMYEVMQNMTLSKDSIIEFVAIMNNDFFNSLSPKHQAIITEAAKTVERNLRDFIFSSEEKMAKNLESKMNVIYLTDEERALWKEASKPVVDRFIKEVGPMGQDVVNAVLETR